MNGITGSIDMSLFWEKVKDKFWEKVKDREAWCAAAYGVTENQT